MTQQTPSERTSFDDTLDDGAGRCEPESQAERDWLTDQRFVHGMLRWMNTVDAASREARVQAILEQVRERRVVHRHWFALAAAVLVTAVLGWWLYPGQGRLPQAHAMVESAVRQLASPVDRAYDMVAEFHGKENRFDFERRFSLVTRPGKKFLLEGPGLIGRMKLGSDGETLWLEGGPSGPRWSGPLATNHRLNRFIGRYFETGFMDLQTVIANMPQHCRLEAVQRLPASDGSPERILVRAIRLPTRECRFSEADFYVEEESGQLQKIVLKVQPPTGDEFRLTLVYRGVVDVGDRAYQRPW